MCAISENDPDRLAFIEHALQGAEIASTLAEPGDALAAAERERELAATLHLLDGVVPAPVPGAVVRAAGEYWAREYARSADEMATEASSSARSDAFFAHASAGEYLGALVAAFRGEGEDVLLVGIGGTS